MTAPPQKKSRAWPGAAAKQIDGSKVSAGERRAIPRGVAPLAEFLNFKTPPVARSKGAS